MNNNEALLNRRVEPLASDGILKYNQFRNYKGKKYLCFIEGSTDEIFYKNIKNYKFVNEISNYIFNSKSLQNKGTKGKENVIRQYYYVKK